MYKIPSLRAWPFTMHFSSLLVSKWGADKG
jgi:hypothetical protein